MTPIIRLTILALAVPLVGCACLINPTSTGPSASAPRIQVTQVPSAAPSASAWVLTPLGLNVHSAADPNASRLATLTQATRLDVSEKQSVGGDVWLHVKTQDGQVEGWVLDHPDLLIHRPVSLHVEQGTGYSILFPADWSPVSGNPATFTGSSGAGGGSLLVQTADDPARLMATPTSPGKELRQESPVEVYGRTTFLTVYRADAGGWEYDVKLQFPKTKVAYLFAFRQPGGGAADSSLFKQLLLSAVVPGEA